MSGNDKSRQCIEKQRHTTLPIKVYTVKAMVFLAVIYGCESWTIKEAESQKMDAFELWCLRRLLRVHWSARRSNQSILKEINPAYSLEGLILKLKLNLQYFGNLMWRADSLKKTLMLRKIEGRRRRGWQEDKIIVKLESKFLLAEQRMNFTNTQTLTLSSK